MRILGIVTKGGKQLAKLNIPIEKAGQAMKQLIMGDKTASQETVFEEVKTKFKDDVIAYLNKELERRKEERLPLELQWRLNINFYEGNQFTEIDYNTSDIFEVPMLAEWEEREIFNEIAPTIETRLAFLNKRKNNMKNIPGSTNRDDRVSAKIGNRILAATKKRLEFTELQSDANLLSELTGTAIWKTIWDVSKGNIVGEIELPDDDSMSLEQETMENYERELLKTGKLKKTKIVREGDVNTSLHSCFEIYPESVYSKPRNNRNIMHVVLMTPEELFEKYGITEKGEEHTTYKIVSSSMLNYGGMTGRKFGQSLGIARIPNTIEVGEYYELPSSRYPDGRLIIWTKNNLIHYGPLPDKLGENNEYKLPFDVQKCLRTDGFFGKSVIERLIPLQKRYNALKNRKQDYLNRLAIGVLLAEENSIVDEDYYMENGIGPGEIILTKQGAQKYPEFMQQPSLPATLDREEQELLEAFNRASGISRLSKQSLTPSNVNSGVAIAALAEQDDTRIGLTADNIKLVNANIGKKWLKLYHDNVQYERSIKHIGKNDEVDVITFMGNDLTSFDVMVETEPDASDTLSQKRNNVYQLMASGLFNDPKTGMLSEEGRIKVFEMLELGDWESFIEEDNLHMQKADRENQNLIKGQPAMIREFDDDMIHISKHNNFRLQSEYEDLITQNPQIDMLFEEHVGQHLQNLQLKNATAQQTIMPQQQIAQ